MRPQKRVLLSINEPAITKGVTLLLEKEFAQKYDLSITETPLNAVKQCWEEAELTLVPNQ